jgi:hypothetical protein
MKEHGFPFLMLMEILSIPQLKAGHSIRTALRRLFLWLLGLLQLPFVHAFLDLIPTLGASLPFPDPTGLSFLSAADIRAVVTRFSRKAPTTAFKSIGLDGSHIWTFEFRITRDAIRLHC